MLTESVIKDTGKFEGPASSQSHTYVVASPVRSRRTRQSSQSVKTGSISCALDVV